MTWYSCIRLRRQTSAVILRSHLSCILVTSNLLPLYRSLQIKRAQENYMSPHTTDRNRSDQLLCWKKPTDSPPDRSTSVSDSIGVFHRLKDNTAENNLFSTVVPDWSIFKTLCPSYRTESSHYCARAYRLLQTTTHFN